MWAAVIITAWKLKTARGSTMIPWEGIVSVAAERLRVAVCATARTSVESSLLLEEY